MDRANSKGLAVCRLGQDFILAFMKQVRVIAQCHGRYHVESEVIQPLSNIDGLTRLRGSIQPVQEILDSLGHKRLHADNITLGENVGNVSPLPRMFISVQGADKAFRVSPGYCFVEDALDDWSPVAVDILHSSGVCEGDVLRLNTDNRTQSLMSLEYCS